MTTRFAMAICLLGAACSSSGLDAGDAVGDTVGDAGEDQADAPAELPSDLPEADAQPVAPRGVGVTLVTLVDESRPTPANDGVPAKPSRTLPTRIWYPAAADPAAVEVEDAPGAPDGPFPLVLFVHGSSGTAVAYASTCRAIARAGYVVAAADFPLTSLLTDGGPSDWHVQDQVDDLSFLADRLAGSDAGPAAGLADTSRYAVVGHSTGGTVSLLAAYEPDHHDPRVAAAVDLSGDACFFGDAFFATRPVPLLAVGATRDLYVPAVDNPVRTYDLAQPPKVLVLLHGGTHIHYTDLDIDDEPGVTPTLPADPLAMTLAAWGGGTGCLNHAPATDDAPMSAADQRALVAAWTVAFLDATMRGDEAAIMAAEQAADQRVTVTVAWSP